MHLSGVVNGGSRWKHGTHNGVAHSNVVVLEACVLLVAFLRMLHATKTAFVGLPLEQPRSIVDSVAAAIQKREREHSDGICFARVCGCRCA